MVITIMTRSLLTILERNDKKVIVIAKENFLKNLGSKLADPTKKSSWKVVNKFLN